MDFLDQNWMSIAVGVVLLTIAIVAVCGSMFTVDEKTVGIVQRMGKFLRMAPAGLNFKLPFIDEFADDLDLRLQQLTLHQPIKTKDNVFIAIYVTIQYMVIKGKEYDAYYALDDETQQITSYVFNSIRSHLPTLTLDEAFEQKDSLQKHLFTELDEKMEGYGFSIEDVLVTSIEPDAAVKDAMNQINANQRLQVAAQAKGEAEKILTVKRAEAESESKRLAGEGIANQRKAIIAGLQDSIEAFSNAVEGSTPKDVMTLVMLTQFFDTLKEVGAGSNTMLVPYTPGAVNDWFKQIVEANIMTSRATTQLAA